LFFVGTLFPVLGFFNVYFFNYSFVADHFQYLASLGIIALVSAGAAALLNRWRLWHRPAGYALCLALLATLAALTWRQSRMYTNDDTLYRTTIDRNPDCWMAHYNLGNELRSCGRVDEAIAHFQAALKIKPDYAAAHNNLGAALAGRGRVDEAIAHFRQALETKPDDAEIHYNLGVALAHRGQIEAAIAQYRRAVELKPGYAEAHNNLGVALAGRGQAAAAIAEYRKALEMKPDYAEAHNNLGVALAGLGRFEEALAEYRKAIEIKPDYAMAHYRLGLTLAGRGEVAAAIAQYRKALEIKPDYAAAHGNLGLALAGVGRVVEAIAEYRTVLKINPREAAAYNNLAWLCATYPDRKFRDGAQAVTLARRAVELSPGNPDYLDTLAAAYAEAQRFPEAVQTGRKALDLARQQHQPALAESIRAKLRLYEAGTPFRQPPLPAAQKGH
jgi:tetratricopeptide (TPR) repeat protein